MKLLCRRPTRCSPPSGWGASRTSRPRRPDGFRRRFEIQPCPPPTRSWRGVRGLRRPGGGDVIYHSGDTVVVDGLERPRVDVAILPINGPVGNMDGADTARFAQDIRARLVVPCHYEMFAFNTADPAEFTAACDASASRTGCCAGRRDELADRPLEREDVPMLDALVELPAGRYARRRAGRGARGRAAARADRPLPGRQRAAGAARTRRPPSCWPTTRRPNVTRGDAEAFCASRRRRGCRAPTSGRRSRAAPTDAVAVGRDFDESLLRCAESGWGAGRCRSPRTRAARARSAPSSSPATSGSGSPTARPTAGASSGGGSYLDTGWGLRACRALPADPERATPTTGFRIAIDPEGRSA